MGIGSDLFPSLVAHYKMNDNLATKNVIDSQGYSDGTAQQNTNLLTTIGKVGEAFNFNGTTDYVNTNNSFQSVFQNSFTVGMWLKPTDGRPSGLGKDIFGTWSDDFKYLVNIWHLANGSINFGYQTYTEGNKITTTPVVFADGQEDWHFVVFAIEQITPTTVNSWIYFDGELSAVGGESSCSMSDYVNPNACFIGQVPIFGFPQEGFYFNGPIDNVMIFNKVLSEEEIIYLYNNGNGREDFEEEFSILSKMNEYWEW